jgi:hypothetical protein
VTRAPWWRWLFLLPGLAAVAYGAFGLVTAGGRVPLASWLTWSVGSALLHDLLVAPLWLGAGWLGARLLPPPARPAALVGALVSGVLVLVSLPFVLGFGYVPTNPSFLPRDYGRNLLLVVAAVLATSALWAAVAVRRSAGDARPGDVRRAADDEPGRDDDGRPVEPAAL